MTHPLLSGTFFVYFLSVRVTVDFPNNNCGCWNKLPITSYDSSGPMIFHYIIGASFIHFGA